jgi:thioredoxin 1
MTATLTTTTAVMERIASADRPLLVAFGATWCPPCRTLDPILDELAGEHADAFELEHVDVDDVPDLVARWDIVSAPTMLVFDGGEPVLRLVGARSKAALLEALSPIL